MIDLTQEGHDARIERLIHAIDEMTGADGFEFTTNTDPNDLLQQVWKKRAGLFQCMLLEQSANIWRVKVTPKSGCCGQCG